jgi:hypothetical protein
VISNCTYCEAGFYADRTGSGYCLACALGRYSETGASVCTECANGRYTRFYQSTGCEDCEAGKYQSSSGSSYCSACLPGTAATQGLSICSDCSNGFAAPLSAMEKCIECPPHSVSSDNRDTCNCFTGYFDDTTQRLSNATDSQLREWIIENDQIGVFCYQCVDGMDCDTQGTRFDKLEVESGWWRLNSESKRYYSCLVETFCTGGYQTTCKGNRDGPLCSLCKPGYSETADRNCGICEPSSSRSIGYFTSIAIVFIIGATLVMGIHARADRNLLEELARYMYQRDELKRKRWIEKWTRHGDTTTNAATATAAGDTPMHGNDQLPPSPGAPDDDDDDNARPQQEGDAYFDGADAFEDEPPPPPADDNDEPPPPPSTDDDPPPPPPSDDTKIDNSSTDTKVASPSSATPNTAPDVSRATSIRSQQQHSRVRDNARRAQQAKKQATQTSGQQNNQVTVTVTHHFKILLAFFQIATTLAFTLQLPWPTAYRVFLSAFEWLNLDLVKVSGAGCVTTVDFYTSWLAMMILPIIVALLLTIVCLIAAYVYVPYTYQGTQRQEQRRRWFHIWAKLAVFTLFLLYPRLSAACLQLFVCTNVEDVDYLVADFSVHCFDSR